MKRIRYWVILIVMFFSLVPCDFVYAESKENDYFILSGTKYYDEAYKVLELVNKERAAVGVDPVVMDEELLEKAMFRAAELVIFMCHKRPNGEMFHTVFSPDFRFGKSENIATCSLNAEYVMSLWMESTSGHRENILDPSWTSVGVGCFVSFGNVTWVQLFSNKDVDLALEKKNEMGEYEIEVIPDNYVLECMDSSVSIPAGDSQTIQIVSYNPKISGYDFLLQPESFLWKSSDENIVSINNEGKITGIREGTATITATTKNGKCSANCTVTVWVPEAVENLKAISSGKQKVSLTWEATQDADGYLIYAQKNGKYGYVGMTTKGTSYTDTKALDSDYNFYWVFPYVKDANGKMHPGGCTKYVYAKGVCPAVTNLKASSVSGGVKLTWTAAAGAEGYLVYGIENGGAYGYVGMTKGTTFTAKKASKSVYNFYWIFPYHKDANGKMITGGVAPYTYGRAK